MQTLVDGTERYFTAANFNADGTQLSTVSYQWHVPVFFYFQLVSGLVSGSFNNAERCGRNEKEL